MNNLSKLQSEAVLEFERNVILSELYSNTKYLVTKLAFKQFLSDQIQKAYSEGREEIEPFKTFLLNEGYSEVAIGLMFGDKKAIKKAKSNLKSLKIKK